MKKVKESALVMVVDDSRLYQRVTADMLKKWGHSVVSAENGMQCMEKLRDVYPDVILLDVVMPGIDGFEVLRRLKNSEDFKNIPVVIMTTLSDNDDRIKALEYGAEELLTKPLDPVELAVRIRSLLKVKAYHEFLEDSKRTLEGEIEKKTEQLRETVSMLRIASLDTIYRLSRAAEYRDEDTRNHLERMSRYAAAIARSMGMESRTVEMILHASPMHDVGKIGVPDSILLKPGKLSPDAWKVMKMHTIIGGKILEGAGSELLNLAEEIALKHHEKWDGSGYPFQLKGEDIPVSSRIVSVADVFDALVTKRPYKEPYPIEQAFRIIREGAGKDFSPEVVEAFFKSGDEVIEIKRKYSDEK